MTLGVNDCFKKLFAKRNEKRQLLLCGCGENRVRVMCGEGAAARVWGGLRRLLGGDGQKRGAGGGALGRLCGGGGSGGRCPGLAGLGPASM